MKIGIVGATQNKYKYGYKVLKSLINKGYTDIFPVNPNYPEIEGLKCYSNLADIPEDLDLVVFIIPPQVGIKVLEEVLMKNIKNVWFQPGAESEEIEGFCKSNNLNYSFYNCIMVEDRDEIEKFIRR